MLTANLLICPLHGGTVIESLSPGPHHTVLLWWPHRAPSHSHTGNSYLYANILGGNEFSCAQISKGTVPCSSISWSCLNLDGIVSLPQLAFSLLDKHFVLILFCFTDNDDNDNSLSVLYSTSKFLDYFLCHSFIFFFPLKTTRLYNWNVPSSFPFYRPGYDIQKCSCFSKLKQLVSGRSRTRIQGLTF